MQSSSKASLHIALILDGNGRWATQRGLPRVAGHRAGVEAVRRAVEAAPECGIGVLTLYAFSADNWRRPEAEVRALMDLLRLSLRREIPRLKRANVRLTAIGRRDRLPGTLRHALARAEWETRHGERLHLRVALDYSARDTLTRAAHQLAEDRLAALFAGAGDGFPALSEPPSSDAFARLIAEATGDGVTQPVDLLVRTSGEQRLSDFLLWEAAYAELLFLSKPWPDFTSDDLAASVEAFRQRERRFGGLAAQAGEPSPLAIAPRR